MEMKMNGESYFMEQNNNLYVLLHNLIYNQDQGMHMRIKIASFKEAKK